LRIEVKANPVGLAQKRCAAAGDVHSDATKIGEGQLRGERAAENVIGGFAGLADVGDVVAVKHGDFAVQEQRGRAQSAHGCGDIRETIGAVDGVAGRETDARSLFISQNAVAIIFFFIDPAGLVERLAHECCQHGLSAKWNL